MTTETVQQERSFNMNGRRVLVLDAAFQPVGVVSWQRAFVLLCARQEQKRASTVIAYSKDGAVVGVRRDIPVPSIIQIGDVVPRWKQRVRFCRKSVFARDQFACQYCGRTFMSEDLTLDHVLPRAQGGTTTWENVACACMDCNQRKANRTPEQAGMRLLRKPKRPTQVMQIDVRADLRHVPPEWAEYWNTLLTP
jgi:5-methylcytosine-specific restriction endonuclease McrA